MGKKFIATAAVSLAAIALPATAQTVTVNATNGNLYLAGQPLGSSASGDTLNASNGPLSVSVSGGEVLTFDVTGSVNNVPGDSGLTPDGGSIIGMSGDAGTGIAGPGAVPINALLGLFLGAGVPGGIAPAQLSFTSDFTVLAPALGQIFFIGDGRSTTSAVQQFTVPTGAARLFLGSADGCCWNDNYGAFSVKVHGASSSGAAVPEPATWAMMLGGLAVSGAALRRRSAKLHHA